MFRNALVRVETFANDCVAFGYKFKCSQMDRSVPKRLPVIVSIFQEMRWVPFKHELKCVSFDDANNVFVCVSQAVKAHSI